MAGGRPITRNGGVVHPNLPAGGVHGAAVTVTGTVVPNGAAVEIAFGSSGIDVPSSGWLAATSDVYGGWSLATVYPAAGTWFLWARLKNFTRVDEAVGTVTVT